MVYKTENSEFSVIVIETLAILIEDTEIRAIVRIFDNFTTDYTISILYSFTF